MDEKYYQIHPIVSDAIVHNFKIISHIRSVTSIFFWSCCRYFKFNIILWTFVLYFWNILCKPFNFFYINKTASIFLFSLS
ncbi:hypothetical protein PNEG_00169 [Pneumocystis murina B123]|uniref:Uncharacterized protein n=1 Tax=Pneumocystis murina (strain B123) TaxID=1069680 RepID=M7PCV9_PNEMU|nr:hypothetical protein PNEG_00169 [Pneumocystis murina B123]EMR11735.1 hypothetical protein PNEG_00169 [Pneumocystis murina B123]